VVEHLPSKCETLNSNLSIAKGKKKTFSAPNVRASGLCCPLLVNNEESALQQQSLNFRPGIACPSLGLA
jgi:hypothetical protein